MKEIPTREAVGHVLCHDITRIVPGEAKGPAFRKGHIVQPQDIEVLLNLGKERLYVWQQQPGMVHENEAAQQLYQLAASAHMRPTPVQEGKIEVMATANGLLRVDVERLRAVNSVPGVMVAARRTNCPVKTGDKLAGTRVIPLVIAQSVLDEAKAQAAGAPLLTLTPYRPRGVGIVTTGNEVFSGRIQDAFTPVIRQKLAEFGGFEEVGHVTLPDDHEAVTAAIQGLLAKGAQLVVCSGGMSVDPDDKTPLAIRNTGARVVSYGAPVLPGAMFMLAYTAAGVPIVGLPGCVMYAKRTIFDIVLPRLMAGVEVTAPQLAALGHGGLCLNCESCIYPNCAFGAGV